MYHIIVYVYLANTSSGKRVINIKVSMCVSALRQFVRVVFLFAVLAVSVCGFEVVPVDGSFADCVGFFLWSNVPASSLFCWQVVSVTTTKCRP